jgi:ectoine hydroxylase-related dioxygenase (phytanoyl-CoA dioxygenase family)
MGPIIDVSSPGWLELSLDAVRDVGYAIVTGAIPESISSVFFTAATRLDAAVAREMGQSYALSNLEKRGRIERQAPFAYDPHFLEYLELPATTHLVERWLGAHATLRSQTLEIQLGQCPTLLQSQWHMNFKEPAVKALDLLYFPEPMKEAECCLQLVPGSHRRTSRPSDEYLAWACRGIACPAGSLVVMDARLWHRERPSDPQTRQCLVHNLFVPHWVKPFFDYPRLVGKERMETLSERVQTYLGWFSRPPRSLAEFALPPGHRTYREGQWDI